MNNIKERPGDTPCELVSRLAEKLGVEKLYLKREDLNPTGSHKDRGVSVQIASHIAQGATSFIISSSGNAAVSASKYCKEANVPLTIFLSPKTPESKLKRISKYPNLQVITSRRPKSDAIKLANYTKAVLLRGSVDPLAIDGYKVIATELATQVPNATDIFIPCSSGTSTVGVFQGYIDLVSSDGVEAYPRFHIVQTTRVCPIAREFDKDFQPTRESVAQAIVDRVALRRNEVISLIKKSEGHGWVVGDEEILFWLDELHNKGVNCSEEGAMTLAAVKKATDSGWEMKEVVCLITGI